MATLTRIYAADFGPGRTGLATVGYTLTGSGRVTAGVAETPAGSGIYQATVTHDEAFTGTILWDTAQTPNHYAVEEIWPTGGGTGPAGPAGPPAQSVPGSVPLTDVYCSDEDLLLRASQDYINLCPKSQMMAFGTDGAFATDRWTMTSATVDLGGQGVIYGHVIALTKPAAAFPIAGGLLMVVDSATTGSATLRRPGQAVGMGQPPAPAAGLTAVQFQVLTYNKQIENATFAANKFFGIDPANPSRSSSQLYEPRELQQFVVLTVLRQAYIAGEKAAAGDYALKLADVTVELDDLKSRLTIHWGSAGQGQPATSMFSARTRR